MYFLRRCIYQHVNAQLGQLDTAELRPPCCSDRNYPRYLLDGTHRRVLAFYSHTATSQQQGSLAKVVSFALNRLSFPTRVCEDPLVDKRVESNMEVCKVR